MTGQLWLVSTPIGNLGDLPPRAVATLRACALICCEDTRHSGKLLSHAGVAGVRLAVANEHTEDARTAEVLELLSGGHDVAVEKILQRHARSLEEMPWFLEQADRAWLFDNSGGQPKLIGEKSKGVITLAENALPAIVAAIQKIKFG